MRGGCHLVIAWFMAGVKSCADLVQAHLKKTFYVCLTSVYVLLSRSNFMVKIKSSAHLKNTLILVLQYLQFSLL